jgi:predicted esterase
MIFARLRGGAPSIDSPEPGQAERQLNTPRAFRLSLSGRDPRGLITEQRERGASEVAADYAPAKQSFEVVAPVELEERPVGVLVWISANSSGALPDPEWGRVLRDRRLIWIGANGSGNDTEVSTRVGLAVDALASAEQRFHVDAERVFVSGFSGGAKVAFRVLLLYPDRFRGALLNCGIEYFRDVPARSSGEGKVWFKRMSVPRDLDSAKSRGVYVITGTLDMNLGHITDVEPALIEDGFSNVLVVSLEGMAHQKPPATAFAQGLDWLAKH